MTWGGRISCPERGDIAAGAAVRCGATPLEALVVGHTAAHGSYCWLTDTKQADLIVQTNGKHPHPRSVARARRNAARKGFLQVKRVFPNQRPKGASFRSSCGTTNKAVNFRALQVRDPITRGQLKRIHMRETAQAEPRREPGPKYSSAAREVYPRPPAVVPPEIARMAAEAVGVLDAREHVRHVQADARMFESLRRTGRAPPG
jgi:hypothetical protein